jgi:hypothetical protein
MSFRQPQVEWYKRHLHCKSQKKSPPKNIFSLFRKSEVSEQFIICCPSSTILEQKKWLHSQTSKKSIKNQLICSFYFTCTRSTQSNKQKHWQLCTFIQYIKTNQINSCKTSKLKGCEKEKSCIKRSSMIVYSSPTTLNSNWYLKSSLQNYPKTDSILTKFQIHSKKPTPPNLKRKKILKRCSIKSTSLCKGKTRKQAYTLKKSSLTKYKSNISMTPPLRNRSLF